MNDRIAHIAQVLQPQCQALKGGLPDRLGRAARETVSKKRAARAIDAARTAEADYLFCCKITLAAAPPSGLSSILICKLHVLKCKNYENCKY